MQFHQMYPGGMGYFSQGMTPGQPVQGYGHYGAAPAGYGYYGEPADPYGAYAEPSDPYGYYGEPADPYGYYGEPADPYGYYAEANDPYGYYGDPVEGHDGYDAYDDYAEPSEMQGYAAWNGAPGYGSVDPTLMGYGVYSDPAVVDGYGQVGNMPEMPGYAEPDFASPYPSFSYYGDPYLAGYQRDRPSPHNPHCPMPTNVAGYNGMEGYDGYVKPQAVSPTCEQMTPHSSPEMTSPDFFKPHW